MRGWPPAEVLLLACLLSTLLLPLIASTKKEAATLPEVATQETQRSIRAFVSAKFAHAPESFHLDYEGKRLWEIRNSAQEHEFFEEIEVPLNEGVEMLIAIQWPEGTGETAVEINVEPDGLNATSRVLWGSGEWEEIVFFRW